MNRKLAVFTLSTIALVALVAHFNPRPIDCAVRGTIAADTTLTAGSAGGLSTCSASGVNRIEARIIGAVDQTDCLCVSPNAGTDWVTVDGEQPVWASSFTNIVDSVKLANGGTDCAVCDENVGRSFEVVIY